MKSNGFFRVILIDKRDGSISGNSFAFPSSALQYFQEYGKNDNLEVLFLNDCILGSSIVRYSKNLHFAAITITEAGSIVDFLYQDYDQEKAMNYLFSKSVLGNTVLELYSFKRSKVIVSEEFNG